MINGTKIFTSNGTLGDYIQVFCKTNPEEPGRHNRYSLIRVETDREGYEANKLKNKLGIRAADTAEVVFKDARVPVTNRIGNEKEGFRMILALFNRERITRDVPRPPVSPRGP